MIRIFTLIFILFTPFAFGQQVKELKEKYILKTRQLEDGIRKLEIAELLNSHLYWEVRDKIAQRIRPSSEDISKSLESIKFAPPEGTYFLNNKDQKCWFTIDKNGWFTDSAIFENDEAGEKEYWTFFFKNGNIIVADMKQNREGHLIKKIEANDSLFVTTFFNESNGKLHKKRTIKNGGDWQNSVLTEYYDDGSLKLEKDGVNKTEKSFYENGQQKSFDNLRTNERIRYDTKGMKTEHSYPTKENGWCSESFENGVITTKDCNSSDHSQKTKYYYKKGKLDSYEVEDNIKGVIQKYDKNKKLIHTEKAIYIQAAPK
ncbi:hypothetical protein [Empedobacter brevis]|uniref:hypothetical protein n=1 Tax=Empedobacter brevis TaxID=247 RepID=UPI002898FA32|nr:hypothetical protein [Empedobacter brevis]